jgi:hypothetical protein
MKQGKWFCLLFFCWLFSGVNLVPAQVGIVDREAKSKPSLMLVGSYHFANPGRDIVKSKVTDVSTPERQSQLEALVGKLKKFKPTKIVLECGIERNAEFQEKYSKYLAGDYKLSINEREQIGFRLAKAAGHRQIYCVDWDDAPGSRSDYNYSEFAAKDQELDAFLKKLFAQFQADSDKENEKLFKLSILDQFIYMHDAAEIEKSHVGYYDIMRIGRGNQYIGANWVSYWYGRNMKILANIIRITDSPQERILAVYGLGHLKLLNQFAAESGFYNVENSVKYLKSKN